MKHQALKEEIRALLLQRGFAERRPGAFYKQYHDNNLYRYLLKDTSLRREVQASVEATKYSPVSKFWVRLSSGYLHNISIKEVKPGIKQICGMSQKGC